jgi:hypothetical protein
VGQVPWPLYFERSHALFQLEFTKQTKIIAFADDLIILTKGELLWKLKII